MEQLFTSEAIISFLILVVLEIVLGIDNVIFVSLILNRLPEEKRGRARTIWMVVGILTRSALLFGLSWLLQQKGKALFTMFGR
ncbi:MAG: TerC family protein, partial [Bacteroidetes bacterium]